MSRVAANETLAGEVERVTFHNPESGFCVLRVKIRGQRDLATVVGQAASVSPGEWVHAAGSWQNTLEHGLQFRAAHLGTSPPSSVEGMERYLGSGLIRGVGRELARRLVAAFGERVFAIIDEHPERLRTVDGIGPVRLKRILDGWDEQKAVREIMVFLQSHGVGSSRAVRIYRAYGDEAVARISEDPYCLARDIRGIGFQTADQIARHLGIATDHPLRARAGLSYTLAQAMADGHCALPRRELLDRGEKLLDITTPKLEEALAQELLVERLVSDTIDGEPFVFLPGLWQHERVIAERLLALAQGVPPWRDIEGESATAWVEKELSIELAKSQRSALALALSSKAMVITGGPGVGKTTLVRAILRVLAARSTRVYLAAPTGRAARRLAESTGLEAKTLHRLLEVDPRSGGFRRSESEPLDCDLLVVDEVSMVDVSLMAAVLRALPSSSALLLVGDVDQLPSVGPGQVLADIIASRALPVARLEEVFRQAAESQIITNAHRINRGLLPDLDRASQPLDNDLFWVDATADDAARKIVEVVQRRIPRRFGFDPMTEIQVLCPMNRGPVGARALNLLLQEQLNPARSGSSSVERFGVSYRVGDKVMQVENDYDREVFNGDVGHVIEINEVEREVCLAFEGRRVLYRFDDLDQLVLAYATTIHKSQGSEYPAVVIPLLMQHYLMLRRNLIYTGLTRGRQLVVLIGERRALAAAVKSRPQGRRWSKLRSRLTPTADPRQGAADTPAAAG